ncbi:MAG: glycosyl hydrolase 115 family protein [Tannerellaceae bacterium]|nr:glycosyl hydrolase 115 family protein [Tannerellaceae bacterium]
MKLLIKILLPALFPFSLWATDIHYPLIKEKQPASIYYEGRSSVVNKAIQLFTEDAGLVCGTPAGRTTSFTSRTIVIGITGQEEAFDTLLAKHGIDGKEIAGKWEAFQWKQITTPESDLLFVIGSDPRGTAYGVLELSRQIGVSPWIWWADVIPPQQNEMTITGTDIPHEPSVKYRGIFLNDEDWALMPWSSRTFEPTPQKGRIGPKTYGKICELLLRLRANTLWPAMHECTIPFYFVDGNKEIADEYGIVLGTSHCEPLMRNSAGEWNNKERGIYNFLTNREGVINYWTERLDEVKETENIFTVGMRGVHDGRMQGVSSLDEETAALQQILKVQRELLSTHREQPANRIPQAFIPYKEVLKAYDNGLNVPEDITLVWCDDNHGYINRLSTPQEQKREGGAGVYYHISYWGKPHDYLWLASTQPGLIYTEMKRAWDYGARQLWVLNVGDIKPGEYLTEFFLDMAWNIESIQPETIYTHRKNWLACLFGTKLAANICHIMQEYDRLAAQRRPEHLGWNRVENYSPGNRNGLSPVTDTEFNPFAFGDEIETRLKRYEALTTLSKELYKQVNPENQAAYFQLIHYPVLASAAMNRKLLYAQKARLYARHRLPVANEYSRWAREGYYEIASLDYHYNKDMLNGKWDGMMDMKPRDLPVFQEPPLPEPVSLQESSSIYWWLENDSVPRNHKEIRLPGNIQPGRKGYFLSLFSTGSGTLTWEVQNIPQEIEIKEIPTGLQYEKRIEIHAASSAKESNESFVIDLIINGEPYQITGQTESKKTNISSEYNHFIALNATDATYIPASSQKTEGLGHSGEVVSIRPVKKITPKTPALEFEVETSSQGECLLKIGTIPRHPANGGEIRLAVVIDQQPAYIVSLQAEFLTSAWSGNVLRNQTLTLLPCELKHPGKHTIRLYALDEEILVDQLMIDFNKQRTHYVIPTHIY